MKRRDLLLSPINRIKKVFSNDEDSQEAEAIEREEERILRRQDLVNAISTDFGSNQLMHELMQLGIDPTNYTHQEMIDIIIAEMEKRRPQMGI